MSEVPLRVDVKARRFPSGEYFGRASVALCEIRRCACPPRAGTTQMSPPDANAISVRSGEMLGSANDGKAESAAIRCVTLGVMSTAREAARSRGNVMGVLEGPTRRTDAVGVSTI